MVFPKEHGAWAMLIVPFLASLAVYEQNILQLPLFLGMFFLYLSFYPLLMILRNRQNAIVYRNWLLAYGALAILFLAFPLWRYPQLLLLGILILPLLAINMYFAHVKREREIVNSFCSIAAMSLGAVACGYLAVGHWTITSLWIWLLCVVFFMGSVFFVKSMIREKKNPLFRKLSWGYHVAILVLTISVTGSWVLMLAYSPSLMRALVYSGRNLLPHQIGLVELANSLWFLVLMIAYFM